MSAAATPTIWTESTRRSDALQVHLLGMVDFDAALFLQERLVYELSGRDDLLGGVLVCEHPPLVTIGREGSRGHLCDPHELTARQMETRWLNRGGGCIVHGPGQLAVYPILPLDRLELGLPEFTRRLEDAVIDVCGEFRIAAERCSDSPGVACRVGQFAQVGVAVRSWVSYHGLYVNVAPDLELMRLASPAGSQRRITSLAAQRMRPTSMHGVRESLVRNLASRFAYADHYVFTGHPLLRRTKRRIHAHV